MDDPDVRPFSAINIRKCVMCPGDLEQMTSIDVCRYQECSTGMHWKCAEKNYDYITRTGYTCTQCNREKLIECKIPIYNPSTLHWAWHSLKGIRRPGFFDKTTRHPTTGENLEDLSDQYVMWGRNEAVFAWYSEKLLLLVLVMGGFGIFSMILSGALDWRLEIGYWTTMGFLFIIALSQAAECGTFFYNPRNVNSDDMEMNVAFENGIDSNNPSRNSIDSNIPIRKRPSNPFVVSLTRSYQKNRFVFYAHFAVLIVVLISFMAMMSLSSNTYSLTWNGIVVGGFLLCALVMMISRKRKVDLWLSQVVYSFVDRDEHTKKNRSFGQPEFTTPQ
jgi:hypothetical protein